jgi:hypothetical protein
MTAELQRDPSMGEWKLEDPGLFGALDLQGHEEVIHCSDAATGWPNAACTRWVHCEHCTGWDRSRGAA